MFNLTDSPRVRAYPCPRCRALVRQSTASGKCWCRCGYIWIPGPEPCAIHGRPLLRDHCNLCIECLLDQERMA